MMIHPTVNLQDEKLYQLGFVTHDLDSALDYWIEVAGAGPFFVGQFHMENQICRGRPSSHVFTAANGFSGEIMIEVIRPDDDEPSVYSEWLEIKGKAPVAGHLHHLLFLSDNYEKSYERYVKLGAKQGLDGNAVGGGRVCYLDLIDSLGYFVELMDQTPVVQRCFKGAELAHRNWDGTNPIRPFEEALAIFTGQKDEAIS